ncbi:MAG: hypothetical protein H7320_22150 [Ferruginibacter sp.]|nr:hypothetical protein [Ferruginibacter sp.]
MKKIFIIVSILFLAVKLFAQSKEAGTDRKAIKQFINRKDTMPALSHNKNAEAIKNVLKQYNNAFEKLDLMGTEKFIYN